MSAGRMRALGIMAALALMACPLPAAPAAPAPPAPESAAPGDPEAAAPPTAQPADELEFEEVMETLRKYYANPELLRDAGIGQAALDGVLDRLGANAMLVSEPASGTRQYDPVKAEVLPYLIGYIRVPSFQATGRDKWPDIQKRLREWDRGAVIGVILDVRDFQASGDFDGAQKLASLFLPPDMTLYTIQGLQVAQEIFKTGEGAEPVFTKPIAILTNPGTKGAGEAFAAALRQNTGALIVGQSTAGQAARYTESKLASGRYLRLASGEVALADGTRLFGRPVTPDVPVVADAANQRRALQAITEKGARSVAKEWPRRQRMSEAALVREENPELDAALARNGEDDDGPPKDFLQDMTLLRAMDALRVIELSKSHREAAAQRDAF